MKIECPECEFWREVPDERLPRHAVIVTCPQCGYRFPMFHEESELTEPLVPHGAHIPHSEEPLYTQAHLSQDRDAVSQRRQRSREEARSSQGGHEQIDAQCSIHRQDKQYNTAHHKEYDANYDSEAPLTYDDSDGFALENPWDNIGKNGYLASFYQTLTSVMFAPQRFFAGIVPQRSHVHILIFFVLLSLLQIIVERFWGGMMASYLASTAINDPELQALISMLTPRHNVFFSLLLGAALATVKIFFTSIFYFAFFKLSAPQTANFSLIFQIVAYASAPLLLCFVPALGSVVGFIWSVVCTLIGCRYAMRLSWGQVIIGVIPYYLIALPAVFIFVNSI